LEDAEVREKPFHTELTEARRVRGSQELSFSGGPTRPFEALACTPSSPCLRVSVVRALLCALRLLRLQEHGLRGREDGPPLPPRNEPPELVLVEQGDAMAFLAQPLDLHQLPPPIAPGRLQRVRPSADDD
jgi:hypothetical protein